MGLLFSFKVGKLYALIDICFKKANSLDKTTTKTIIDKYNYKKLGCTVDATHSYYTTTNIYVLNNTLNSEQISECLSCGHIKKYSKDIIELSNNINYDEPLIFKETFNNVNKQSIRFYPEIINNRYRTPFKVYKYQVDLFNNLLEAVIVD